MNAVQQFAGNDAQHFRVPSTFLAFLEIVGVQLGIKPAGNIGRYIQCVPQHR